MNDDAATMETGRRYAFMLRDAWERLADSPNDPRRLAIEATWLEMHGDNAPHLQAQRLRDAERSYADWYRAGRPEVLPPVNRRALPPMRLANPEPADPEEVYAAQHDLRPPRNSTFSF